jgi:hypothetical protein
VERLNMLDSREAEIRRNYEFFKSVVASLLPEHAGEVALIHERKIVGYFETASEAVTEGTGRFGNLPFSVQRVINRPIDLGFLSHAADSGLSV